MQNTLGDLVEALQQAVDRAQEQLQAYQLRMLQEYFDEENRPLYVRLRLPRLVGEGKGEDGKGVEHLEVDVPRISLVKMGTVLLDELEVNFPLRFQELTKEEGQDASQLMVEFPGSIQQTEDCAHVRIRFKSGEPPEAVMKLNDTLLTIIP